MKFLLKATEAHKQEVDVLVVFCRQDKFSDISFLGNQFAVFFKDAAKREGFTGEKDTYLTLTSANIITPYKTVIAGLGDKETADLTTLYQLIAKVARKISENKPARIAVCVPDVWQDKFSAFELGKAVVESIRLSTYHFKKYKGTNKQPERELEEVRLVMPARKLDQASEGIKFGNIEADACIYARDMVNEPSDVTTPSYIAKEAGEIAKSSPRIKVEIMEKEQVQKLGMNAFMAVARGSSQPLKFIRLEYKPGKSKKRIVLVGKCITFDSGGLSIKSAEHMETMKLDMSGAAAVLGVFKALTQLNPEVTVIGLIAACENMPSGQALKPGDILKALNGKTIEVLNTDAEGRLTLADALSYAVAYEKPDAVIDIATLTGACMVALGQEVAGLWGNDDSLLTQIEKAAADSAERVWRMPLAPDYKELIKSHIADIKNVQTGRYGGAITAALFLEEFVNGISWIHLDVAGPAYEESDTPLAPKGGVGFGVRTFISYLFKQ